MSIGQRLVGIVVLATSSVVFAQTTETKPPQRPQPNFSAAQTSSKTLEASEKARVFITDSQSWEMSEASAAGFGGTAHGGARPQTAEIIKTFGEGCPEVLVNNIQEKTDYIVLLDHEGGKGDLPDRDKVAVFARLSRNSIVSKSTLSLGESVQEACEAIRKAWALGSMIAQSAQAAAANRRGYGGPGQAGEFGSPCGSGALDQAAILTDTMGVDFGPYLTRVVQIVKQNWYKLQPPSVYPPILKQGKLSIEFVILKDGKTTGMVVHTSSGDVALDRAAWDSITASTPFPPLPQEFPGQILGLRFYYFYNLNPTGTSIGIAITPCGDVQVPVGSTLQFSVSGKGITDASVTWSVSGNGCSKSACGTISDTGLYTSPADIPNPPTIIVEATSRTDMSVTAKSKVTVVQANPSH